MSIQNILCVIDQSNGAEKAFSYATNLARIHESNLVVLYAVPNLPATLHMATQFNREWLDVFLNQYESEAGRLYHHYCSIAKKKEIDFEWISEQGDAQSIIEKHSRLVDLVITAKSDDEEGLIGTKASIPAHVLELATPSIILPPNRSDLLFPKKILVAWDGGKHAAKALKASIPLIRYANSVRLVEIRSRDDAANQNAISKKSVLQFLSKQGIDASYSKVEPAEGLREVDALFNAVTNERCNLLVMGAYGHSRLSEMVLGGMTKDVLLQLPLPVFMVH